jgi:hypothetical protein
VCAQALARCIPHILLVLLTFARAHTQLAMSDTTAAVPRTQTIADARIIAQKKGKFGKKEGKKRVASSALASPAKARKGPRIASPSESEEEETPEVMEIVEALPENEELLVLATYRWFGGRMHSLVVELVVLTCHTPLEGNVKVPPSFNDELKKMLEGHMLSGAVFPVLAGPKATMKLVQLALKSALEGSWPMSRPVFSPLGHATALDEPQEEGILLVRRGDEANLNEAVFADGPVQFRNDGIEFCVFGPTSSFWPPPVVRNSDASSQCWRAAYTVEMTYDRLQALADVVMQKIRVKGVAFFRACTSWFPLGITMVGWLTVRCS